MVYGEVSIVRSENFLSAYHSYQHHNNCNDKQDVDEAAYGIGGNQSQKPKNNEYNSDRD